MFARTRRTKSRSKEQIFAKWAFEPYHFYLLLQKKISKLFAALHCNTSFDLTPWPYEAYGAYDMPHSRTSIQMKYVLALFLFIKLTLVNKTNMHIWCCSRKRILKNSTSFQRGPNLSHTQSNPLWTTMYFCYYILVQSALAYVSQITSNSKCAASPAKATSNRKL